MPQYARVVWNGPQAVGAAKTGAVIGLNTAAERLAALATPLTPYLDGDLIESQDVHPATETSPEAAVSYDTPYAVDQHEHLEYRHTTDPHPDAQAKYLEAPLRQNADELQKIIAAQLRRAFGG